MPLPKQHEVDVWNRALARVGDTRIVPQTSVAVTSVTAASPPLVTSAAHGYAIGDRVLLYDLTGGTQVNGRVFLVGSVPLATTFTLLREDGSTHDAATGGFAARLPDVKAVRVCFDAWPEVRDEVLRSHPWNSVVRRARLARLQASTTITGVTAANPAVVTTSAPHGYSAGDLVLIDGIVGMTELNARYFTVASPGASTFQLSGEDSSAYTAWSSGGTAKKALPPLKPDFGYAYRYTLPENCERILELADDPDYGWELEGREVLTDAGITVPIRYCARITDPDAWDAQLMNVMAARLAAEIVETLTQSKGKKELILADLEQMMSEARRQDAQEQSPQELAEDSWLTCRV